MFEPTDCIAILGVRGCGKTTLSRKIQSAWPKQVIIDPVAEYSDGIVVNNFEAFSEKMRELKKNSEQKFRLIFRMDPEIEDQKTLLNAILRVCYAFGNIQIVIEETQYFTTPHELQTYLRNALFMGRHQGLSLVFVTQRPGALNKNILSQCRHVFAGAIYEKNDLDYLKSIYHARAEELPKIPKGKFLYFSPGKPIAIVDNGGKK